MNNPAHIKLHWPPACVGCGATTDLQSESIGNERGEANICINCIGVARLEQLLIRGWKFSFTLFSYLAITIVYLLFGTGIVQSLLFGSIMLIPFLLLEGVLGPIKYTESYFEIKQNNHLIFRDSLFTNLFASSNPDINAELDLSFHLGDTRRRRLGLFLLSFAVLLLMSVYVYLEQFDTGSLYFEEVILLLASAIVILVGVFFIGVLSFQILLFIWTKKMTVKFPCEQESRDIPLHTPTLRTGPISSKGDSTFGQNVALDLGQKSVMEKATDAIQGGDFTNAVRLCRKAIDIDPLNIEAWKSLAIAHAKSGKCIESSDALQRARDLAKDPKQMESTLEECKEHCGDIFDLSPTEIIPLASVAPTTSDETQIYRSQIDDDPLNPKAWTGLATALAKSGRCHDARDALQRAKDIDSKESLLENAMKTCKECCQEEFRNFEL